MGNACWRGRGNDAGSSACSVSASRDDSLVPTAHGACGWEGTAPMLESQPAVLSRELHGLGSVAHAEFAEDLGHAVADGAF